MIEETAIINAPSKVDNTAYIGHFSIIGAPETARGFGCGTENDMAKTKKHWRQSRGAEIKSGVTVGSHCVIGDGSVIYERAFVGDGVSIGHDAIIEADAEIYYRAQIFDRVRIGSAAWIAGFVCNGAIVGPRSVVFGHLIHRFVNAERGVPERSPVLGAEVFVGQGAIIIGGVTIGEKSYIAAGSVVTRDVPPKRLFVGAPAVDRGPAPMPFVSDSARNFAGDD